MLSRQPHGSTHFIRSGLDSALPCAVENVILRGKNVFSGFTPAVSDHFLKVSRMAFQPSYYSDLLGNQSDQDNPLLASIRVPHPESYGSS
jgi:hypothetical protein